MIHQVGTFLVEELTLFGVTFQNWHPIVLGFFAISVSTVLWRERRR
jgi:hypothetical protein